MSRILCVTGTGTEIGKTSVSLALLLWAREMGLRAGYMKLIQCGSRLGADEPFMGDADWIEAAQPQTFSVSNVYSFPDPVSPHLAAERSDSWIDMEWIQEQVNAASERCDLLVLEGAGGAAVPFKRDGFSLADLAAKAQWPCLIACPPGLGTLHQTRVTADFLSSKGASLAGFIMCPSSPAQSGVHADNVATLKELLHTQYFGLLPYLPGLHKRLPLPPAMALYLAQSVDAGMKAWWATP